MSEYPGRFGAFASLPLPDVQGALLELEYAMDTLKLDGVVLISNVEGHYAGDPEYDELFAELSRRETVVFLHPNDRPGMAEKTHGAFDPFVEYPIDTSRAFAEMMYNGALERFSGIRFILAHAGGIVPFLAERIGRMHYVRGTKIRWGIIIGDLMKKRSGGFEICRGMYYDIAASANRYALRSLQELVAPSHILFGTNFGWTPDSAGAAFIRDLEDYDGFDEGGLAALITIYIPSEWIAKILGNNNTLAIPLATLIGVPVYTTNMSALGIVGGLLSQGMNPAAALSFLIAGATTTLPAMTAVYGITRKPLFFLYVAFTFFGALIFGYIFQLICFLF